MAIQGFQKGSFRGPRYSKKELLRALRTKKRFIGGPRHPLEYQKGDWYSPSGSLGIQKRIGRLLTDAQEGIPGARAAGSIGISKKDRWDP